MTVPFSPFSRFPRFPTLISRGTRSFAFDYNVWTGQVITRTDNPNNITSTALIGGVLQLDALGRPLAFNESGAGVTRRTAFQYTSESTPSVGRRIVRRDLNTLGDGRVAEAIYPDFFGRTRLVQRLEDTSTESFTNPSHGIKIESRYRSIAPYRYQAVSNPYRFTADQTMGWTLSIFDQEGRMVRIDRCGATPEPFGSTPELPSCTSLASTSFQYNGSVTTITETGTGATGLSPNVVRVQYRDALGRIVRVVENPAGVNYATTYTYNLRDHLLSATQGTQTPRSFYYASLGRLKRAVNPESGDVCYGLKSGGVCTGKYDGNGNLLYKTDARNIVTSFTYNSNDQLTFKTYSDNTPDVIYNYTPGARPSAVIARDEIGNEVARTDYRAYDGLGRVTDLLHQVFTGGGYFGYQFLNFSYNLADGLKSVRYPSGRVVDWAYDTAGRVSGVTGNKDGFPAVYSAQMSYAPMGGLSSWQMGSKESMVFGASSINREFRERTDYDALLRVGWRRVVGVRTTESGSTESALWQIFNSYFANSNVNTQQTVGLGGQSWLQSFSYDGVGRLKTVTEGFLTQTYGYDRYGNRALVSGSSNWNPSGSLTPLVASDNETLVTNQFPNNRWMDPQYPATYDAAGNFTSRLGNSYNYDAENRLVSATVNGVASSYGYDGLGRRVTSTANGVTTVYVYGPLGDLVAEYRTNPPSAPPQANVTGTFYPGVDQLGSTRVLVDSDGYARTRLDYLPFGERISSGTNSRPVEHGNNAARMLFASKERDAETGLDYFGARHFSGAQGRFTSPDAPLADQGEYDPQSWNLYSYVRNNPLRFIDPTGRTCQTSGGSTYDDMDGKGCAAIDEADKKLRPSASVTVSNQELALMALHSVGDALSSPSTWASVAIGGMQGAQQSTSLRGAWNWRWWLGQGAAYATRKQGGARTEPTVPPRTVVNKNGVLIYHNPPGPREHGPGHLHVEGNGPSTKIGQNGKPLDGQPELSPAQRQVVEEHKGLIRRTVDKVMRYFDYNQH